LGRAGFSDEAEHPSSFGETFEFVLARVREGKAGSFKNGCRRSREKDFTGLRKGCYARCNVDCHTAQVLPLPFNLARMNAGAHLYTVLLRSLLDSRCATNRARRAIEHGKESVAAAIHFNPTKAVERCRNAGRAKLSTQHHPIELRRQSSRQCR
jgi:hypothetical protein